MTLSRELSTVPVSPFSDTYVAVETHNVAVEEANRTRRLFNRLEAAVSHHKKAHDSGRYFTDDPDEALWKARDKILKDYAEGNG